MNEEDIKKIAELTAKIVIDHIDAKQDEWNNDFEVNLENFTINSTMQPYKLLDEQEMLDITISELKIKLNDAITTEDYKLANKINSKIIELKAKRK
tara:strand:- start:90 stop:377 length:288 start_codon:yes stop_codon:yes gene_type:complete